MATYLDRNTCRLYPSRDWSELPGVSEIFDGHPEGRDAGLNDLPTRAAATAALSSGYLENPDLAAVKEVPRKYWTVDGDAVREMDAGEKSAIDADTLLVVKQVKVDQLREQMLRWLAEHDAAFVTAAAAVEAATTPEAVDAVELSPTTEH